MNFQLPPLGQISDPDAIKEHAAKVFAGKPGQPAERLEELAKAALVDGVRQSIATHLQPILFEGINRLRDAYAVESGHRPAERAAAAEWDEGLDTAFENYVEGDAATLCGVSFTGEHTIGADLHEDDAPLQHSARFAKTMADAIVARYDSAAKTLSAFGIIKQDIDDMARRSAPPAPTPQLQASQDGMLAALGNAMVMNDLDEIEVMDELETISQDDDILANAACERVFGEDPGMVMAVRAYAISSEGGEWASDLVQAAMNYEPSAGSGGPDAEVAPAAGEAAGEAAGDSAIVNPAAVEPATPAKRTRRSSAEALAEPPPMPADPGVPVSGNVEAVRAALVALTKHGGMAGRDLAPLIGVARTTLSNYINGKGDPDLGRTGHKTVHDLLHEKIAKLQFAKDALVGSGE